ncbi:MAG TPA: glycosyltransferase family 4 protein [Intrasporangium sp.]|uniref:glycosyltransferase family 4 protein n=1 Tax=Intrasporangium sp. TaxID=1925024 RepID=UPI002B47686B|nr:glycosyltransferase family 4 protein [Intrasporangium sp.]HKX68285.1 glycosyltransferase family 4 protein [Intrasporangium sp.]
MRIVHAVCTDAFAGVERHVALLAAAQADQGHEVVVLGGHAATMNAVMDRSDIRHMPARTVGSMRSILNRLGDADIFNVHMTAAEIAAATAWKSRHVPVVATRHFAARRGQSSWAAGVVSRWAARHIAAQIAVSRYVAEHVEPPATVVVSGVASNEENNPAGSRSRTVLVAQRLQPEKRTADAIECFAASGLAGRGWHLHIAGSGADLGRLRGRVAQCGLDSSVRFLGHRRDVGALMADAAILLAPRPDEALGLTVLEAMSHELPVIAAHGGGHLETIGAVAPELCYPVGDLSAGAEILRVLAPDEARRGELGARLRAAQQGQFSLEAQADATEAVYRSVL